MSTLQSILDNTAVPISPLVVVLDSLSAPARPLVRELLDRGKRRGQPAVVVCVLRPPVAYPEADVVVDLTPAPGYGEVPDLGGRIRALCSSLPPKSQVYIDAVDVLAEDHSPYVVLRALRALLAAVNASKPARLILSLPRDSLFLQQVVPASLSPGLALLTPHSARAVEVWGQRHLLTPDSPAFFPLLEKFSGDSLALAGAEGVEAGAPGAWAVQVLVRKASGGAKAIVRATEGWRAGRPVPLGQVASFKLAEEKRVTTHQDLNLPFNLSLTERQKEERGAVPLPYAHEGEGADLGMGMDWSDDEEDDEI